jgi:hypothetical protein
MQPVHFKKTLPDWMHIVKIIRENEQQNQSDANLPLLGDELVA